MSALELANKDDEPDIRVDTPLNLRPDLELLGIQEIDRGICVDDYENRTILRKNKLSWVTVYSETGTPTGQIQAISQEMLAARSATSLEDRKPLLVDSRNKNSDYLTGLDLLVESAADTLAPPWVSSATRSWIKLQQDEVKAAKSNTVEPPGRCIAIKSDGVRCQLWHGGRRTDDHMCRIHLGAVRNQTGAAVEKARLRVFQAAPAAVDVIEELMNTAASEPVRLKAAETLLDRAGIRGGVEIDTTVVIDVRPAAQQINERLARLALGAAAAAPPEILDAEVVEDDNGA